MGTTEGEIPATGVGVGLSNFGPSKQDLIYSSSITALHKKRPMQCNSSDCVHFSLELLTANPLLCIVTEAAIHTYWTQSYQTRLNILRTTKNLPHFILPGVGLCRCSSTIVPIVQSSGAENTLCFCTPLLSRHGTRHQHPLLFSSSFLNQLNWGFSISKHLVNWKHVVIQNVVALM